MIGKPFERQADAALVLTPLQLLDRLSKLITPPRIHKHRYCGVLAPNARLRKAVIASAGPSGATVQLLQEAREKMGLLEPAPSEATTPQGEQQDDQQSPSAFRQVAARSWALLLVRIYECLPLLCTNCFAPMRIVAFIQEPAVVESILRHIGEPTIAPETLPARAPPQTEMDFTQSAGQQEWPDVDQTLGMTDDTWN